VDRAIAYTPRAGRSPTGLLAARKLLTDLHHEQILLILAYYFASWRWGRPDCLGGAESVASRPT
jgi:hypothetical protein